jgi:tRNA(Ile)-lysidine synthase
MLSAYAATPGHSRLKMHSFVRDLITEWRRLDLPFAGETVIIAISGGADSVSLLLAMHDLKKRLKLKHRLVAAHFDHKLRGAESDADEEFVRGLTAKLGIELAVGSERIPADGNLEQNARHERYGFLQRTAQNLDAFAVLTGHTINDQAETVLMNLIRGSGPDGLSGMRAVRRLADENNSSLKASENVSSANTILVRPLLTWAKRIDTEAFCRDSGVEYRYDTMNEDTAFKRVRIRKILLPLLEDMNPNIVETLSNTALLMQGVIETSPADNGPVNNGKILKLKDLATLPEAQRTGEIRGWLGRCRGTTRQLQLKHIRAIERLAVSPKSGRTVELPGGKVVKTAGRLIYEENKVEN